MSEADGITAFIAARLDEEEAGARDRLCVHCRNPVLPLRSALGITGWTHGREGADPEHPGSVWQGVRCSGRITGAEPVQNRDRALREVAARRRVLERHRPVGGTPSYRAQSCAGCGTEGYCDDPVTEKMSDCPELRDMAAIWDDHPDYRTEWKPWT